MQRRSYRYVVTDVFTEVPFAGNQLAVVTDARGLDDAAMQRVAREFNLSETSFVFPPERDGTDARLRIFTPGFEVPFAGHPTIGTAAVLIEDGAIPQDRDSLALDERIGVVAVRIERRADPFLAWLRTPPIVFGRCFDPALASELLGLERNDMLDLPIQSVSAGNPFLYVAVRDADAVDRALLDRSAMLRRVDRADAIGIFVFAPVPGGAYSRMLEPTLIGEDPATGSATGPLGAYLAANGLIERSAASKFTSTQGVAMGRRSTCLGIVHTNANGTLESVEVGGNAVRVAVGTIYV